MKIAIENNNSYKIIKVKHPDALLRTGMIFLFVMIKLAVILK